MPRNDCRRVLKENFCCALLLAAHLEVSKDVWTAMDPGWLAAGAGYTAADYGTAVDAILKSPYKAVDHKHLIAVVGQQSLQAMVRAKQLALQPYFY
jgi:hypothetical protein